MDSSRVNALAGDVYEYVFQMLDSEPELSGMDAGCVASFVEAAFKLAFPVEGEDSPSVLAQVPPTHTFGSACLSCGRITMVATTGHHYVSNEIGSFTGRIIGGRFEVVMRLDEGDAAGPCSCDGRRIDVAVVE